MSCGPVAGPILSHPSVGLGVSLWNTWARITEEGLPTPLGRGCRPLGVMAPQIAPPHRSPERRCGRARAAPPGGCRWKSQCGRLQGGGRATAEGKEHGPDPPAGMPRRRVGTICPTPGGLERAPRRTRQGRRLALPFPRSARGSWRDPTAIAGGSPYGHTVGQPDSINFPYGNRPKLIRRLNTR